MKKFLSLGLIRGILFQLLGFLIGAALMGGIRLLLGLPWSTEPAIVLGGFLSAIFFMVGLGGLRDWWKMALGEEVPEPKDLHEEPGLKRYFGFSPDCRAILAFNFNF